MFEEMIKQQLKTSPLIKKIGISLFFFLLIILGFLITNIVLIIKVANL